jgi:hypothetical protein
MGIKNLLEVRKRTALFCYKRHKHKDYKVDKILRSSKACYFL